MDFLSSYSLFILQNILVAAAAFSLLKIFHNYSEKVEKVILFFLYFYTIIIVIMTLLGTLGILNCGVFLVVLTILNTILFYFSRRNRIVSVRTIRQKFNLKILLLYLPLILLLIIKFTNAAFSAITETDSLVYHLPFAVQWFKTQTIWEPYYTAYAGPLGYYPGNYELLLLYAFFPFKSDILINLVNFPLFIPFALVLYCIARLFNIKGTKAFIVPVLFLFTPLIIRQGGIPQNDLFFIFTFSVAIYFILKNYLINTWNCLTILPIALSLGLFIGTKSSGIIYGGALLILLAFFKKKNPVIVLSALFISFICGGFWYLRNWIYTGNPLFPMELNIAGVRILKGYESFIEKFRDSALISHLNLSIILEVFKDMFLSTGILGYAGILAFGAGVYFFIKKQKNVKNRQLLAFTLIAFLISFGFYLITPFSYANIYPNIRYLLVFFLIGYILFLFIWKNKNYLLVYVLGLVNFLIIVQQKRFLPYINDYVQYNFNQIIENWELTVLLMVIIFSFIFCIFYAAKRRLTVILWLIIIGLFGVFLNKIFPLREQYRWQSFVVNNEYIYNQKIVEAFKYVENFIPVNARIAFTRGPVHYPLFGKQWEREVDYININDCYECRYHNYRTSKKSILRNPNFNDWMSNLKKAKKEYLFIGQEKFETIPPYELDWANLYSTHFEPMFNNGYSYVYKIKNL